MSIYEDLTASFTTLVGKNASKKEREQLNLTDTALVYGEIDFRSFANALLKIQFKYGLPKGDGHTPSGGIMQSPGRGIFVDLGSG